MSIPVQQSRSIFTSAVAAIFDEKISVPSFGRSFINREIKTDTKFVEILARRDSELIAVDIVQGANGNINDATVFTEKIFNPPEYSERVNVSQMDIFNLLPMENQGKSNPNYDRQIAKQTADTLMKAKNKVERAKEKQVWDILNTGVVELQNTTSIDFKRKASMMPALTGTAAWGQSAADIFKNLREWGMLLIQEGDAMVGKPIKLILGELAAVEFMDFDGVKELLNFRRADLIKLQSPQMAANGGVFLGDISIPGSVFTFELWSYPKHYKETLDGPAIPYADTKSIYMLPDDLEMVMTYSQVPKLPNWAYSPRTIQAFNSFKNSSGYDLYYDEEGRKAFYVGVETRPLAQIVTVDKLLSAKVIE